MFRESVKSCFAENILIGVKWCAYSLIKFLWHGVFWQKPQPDIWTPCSKHKRNAEDQQVDDCHEYKVTLLNFDIVSIKIEVIVKG
jgi:hypothetical protein